MKNILLAVMMTGFLTTSSFASMGDPAVDGLVNRLVEKGVITKDDARQIEQDLKNRTDEGSATAGTAAKETPTEASKPKVPFDLKVRMQARLDYGDLLVDTNGRYRTESDLFLRRVRLEIEKRLDTVPIGRDLEMEIVFDADRWDQDFRNGKRRDPRNKVELHYMYADWTFADPFAVEIGKHKQPFIRIELTSSSRQLFNERPAIASVATDLFGDYHQPQIMVHGDLLDRIFRYYLSYSDGISSLDALKDVDSSAVEARKETWGKAYIGRVEIAPLGNPEKKKDDTGMGAENHLTLGVDAGMQNHVRYVSSSSIMDAVVDTGLLSTDLSGRYSFGNIGTVTGQAEYIRFKKNFNYKNDERPKGYYAQLGYLLPGKVLRGKLEPAVRYELFDHDAILNTGESGSREKTYTFGFNHYLLKHSMKWSYNFAHTRFDAGVAEAKNSSVRKLHQLLVQLYF